MIKEEKCVNSDISFYIVNVHSKKKDKDYRALAIKYDDKYYIIKFLL